MKNKKLTYEDLGFKVGDKITCTNLDEVMGRGDTDFFSQHLTIGKVYEIEDLEWRWTDSVCVKSDNGKVSMYFPVELFYSTLKEERKQKIRKLNELESNRNNKR